MSSAASGGPRAQTGVREKPQRRPTNEQPARALDTGSVTDKEGAMKAAIDWASEHHDLCVVDDAGGIDQRLRVSHTSDGFKRLLETLARYGDPADLPIAIERPDGVLVETLLDAGHPVVPIPPAAFAAARGRWSSSGTKSDRADAYQLADFLRTDGHRFRTLDPFDDTTRQLRSLVRLRTDHVTARVAATNQLGALLAEHWPGAGLIFARLDSAIALAFLDNYPTVDSARQLSESASPRSCAATPTAAAEPPSTCSNGCATHPPHRDRSTATACATSSVARAASSAPCWTRSPTSTPRSAR